MSCLDTPVQNVKLRPGQLVYPLPEASIGHSFEVRPFILPLFGSTMRVIIDHSHPRTHPPYLGNSAPHPASLKPCFLSTFPPFYFLLLRSTFFLRLLTFQRIKAKSMKLSLIPYFKLTLSEASSCPRAISI